MTAVIRDTNVYSDLHNCLMPKLKTITDPSGKSKWVYGAFPEGEITSKSDYPLIILTSGDISYDPLTLKTVKRGPVRIVIDVYSTNGAQLDTISDEITNTMEINENNGSFTSSGIDTMRLMSSTYGHFERGALRVHNRTFNYEFDFGWF